MFINLAGPSNGLGWRKSDVASSVWFRHKILMQRGDVITPVQIEHSIDEIWIGEDLANTTTISNIISRKVVVIFELEFISTIPKKRSYSGHSIRGTASRW